MAVATTALAGTISPVLGGRGLLVPTVVLELVLGVIIGPQLLGLPTSDFLKFFSSLGLGMLFFFAGYEIDMRRIAGGPLRLAALGCESRRRGRAKPHAVRHLPARRGRGRRVRADRCC